MGCRVGVGFAVVAVPVGVGLALVVVPAVEMVAVACVQLRLCMLAVVAGASLFTVAFTVYEFAEG